MKRENYISWDEYFMGVSILASKRSKDPVKQVGACIVRNNNILATGYNGFPYGCSDDHFPWEKNQENPLDNKHMYVVHAELNAILNATTNLYNSTLYVSLFPCNECAKAIIQAGISEVVYLSNEKKNKPEYQASEAMMSCAGIYMRKMESTEFLNKMMEV